MKFLEYKKSDITDKTLKKDVRQVTTIIFVYFIVFQFAALVSSLILSSMRKESKAAVNDFLSNSGLPYLIAIGLGLFVIFVSMTPSIRKQTFAVSTRKMTGGIFLALVAVVMTGQVILSVYGSLFEHLVNLIGYTSTEQLKEATGTSKTFSMLLYAGFLGPVTEEIVFRGFLLRNLEKYGQGFAIIISAYMFGLYHSNFLQTPFAFVVGLILGYVALTYGIKWSILLHIFNNFVLGDTLNYFLQNFNDRQADIVSSTLIWTGGVIGMVILWFYKGAIRKWYRSNKPTGKELKLAFTGKSLILITIIIFIISCLGLDKI